MNNDIWFVIITDFESTNLEKYIVSVDINKFIVSILYSTSDYDFKVGQHLYNLHEKYEYKFHKNIEFDFPGLELKLCPFCGKECTSERLNENLWKIGCTNFKCNFRPVAMFNNEEEAELSWNKRDI